MAKQTTYSVLTNHDHLEIESKIYVILSPFFTQGEGEKIKIIKDSVSKFSGCRIRLGGLHPIIACQCPDGCIRMINWGEQHTTSTQKTRCHMRSIRCFQDRGKHFPLAAPKWDDNTCEDPRWWQSFYLINLVAKCQHPKPNTTTAATHPTSQVLLAAHSQHYDVQVLQKGHQRRSHELNRLIWSEAFPKRALRLNL